MSLRVEIGVFSHNEAEGLASTLRGMLAQDIFSSDMQAHLIVLANGCTDSTVDVARSIDHPALRVVDLPQGGKSRTWNSFVHEISARETDILIFADADIVLPDRATLQRLAKGLAAQSSLFALSSQPVKDISLTSEKLTLTERLIAASAGGMDDWQTSICGQLYAMPAARARQFSMPIGLPVEDGFLRAMVLTDHLTTTEVLSRLGGLSGVRHVYGSERSVPALIRHQVRIVIGSAINAAIFTALRRLPPEERAEELQTAARDDGWLTAVLEAELPRAPFGYVPVHFLTKRLVRLFAQGQSRNPRRILLALLGFVFDFIVYVFAQIKMLRGTGAGYW